MSDPQKNPDLPGLQIEKLREKKKLADKVAGEGVKGGLQFVESDLAMELFDEIRKAKGDVSEVVAKARLAVATAGMKKGRKKGAEKKSVKPTVIEDVATLMVPNYDFSDI